MLELNGFTSTSLKKEEVLKYMFKCLSDEDVPLLYQINKQHKYGLKYFKLDSEEYSLFPFE